MARCSYCNSMMFGGVNDQTGRYCNERCREAGHLSLVAQSVPEETLDAWVTQVHQGDCPVCNRPGPVDVHTSHRIWSALILTSWNSEPRLSCRRCGRRRQIESLFLSGVVGWWGFPWGIIITPIQIVRNLIGICGGGPSDDKPSPLLRKFVGLHAASHAMQQQQTPAASSGAPPPPLPGDDSRYRPKPNS